MSHIPNMYGFSDIEILDKLDGLCEGERGLFWFLDISASLYSFSSKCNDLAFQQIMPYWILFLPLMYNKIVIFHIYVK